MKTKIGTEVAHITRDLVTTFRVKRSKVNLQGAASHTAGYLSVMLVTGCLTMCMSV